MNPTQMSARFAAYVWYTGIHGDESTAKREASRFARQNWAEFLPCVHEGLGRLLIRLARGSKSQKSKRTTLSSRPIYRRLMHPSVAAG
jgi:hypothetical protein